MSMLSKEAKKETKERETKVDIPFEKWSSVEKVDIILVLNQIKKKEL